MKAGAALELVPKGNQVAVNIIIILSAGFFGWAVWLETLGKNWILAALVGLFFFIVGSFFWWRSHKNESLKTAHPFSMKVGEGDNSVEVSADARSLPALDYLKGILGQYSAIFHREPIPDPSGTVGADGQPIEGTLEVARKIAKEANDLAQQQSNVVADDICSRVNTLVNVSPVIADISSGDTKKSGGSGG
ncbi:hypothetical protein D3C77_408210 [compost metagenome]